jgi:alkylation response protein AidB-like acyl-CoA dehydrogenase
VNFLLSDDQEQLIDAVLRYARTEGDRGARRGAFDGESDLDRDFWSGLMDLGVAGLMLPERHGGLGLEMIDLALAAEALGHAAAPGPYLGHFLAAQAIALAGDEVQQAEWLPKLASGEVIATVVLDGPEPADWMLDAAGGALSGQARDVIGGAVADILVVGLKGGRFAIMPNGEAVSARPLDCADRTRRIADVEFTQAPAILLARDGAAERVVDAALVLLAADAFGGASRCLAMATQYACDREQFGQPIGGFQGLKFQLADLAVDVEPARGLYWYAAHAYDHVPEDARAVAAAAKAHLGDVFMQAARDTIEVHGGIGYTWEHDAQIYFKRAMFDYAWLGTPAEHRDRQARLNGW